MSMPLWAGELATSFWHRVGEREPFPRTLRRPIARALPLAIISLPRLGISSINQWLAARQIVCRLTAAERPLRACLVAHAGAGAIFLDGSDDQDEQRFSLAHELAHFLRHYWQPRERAVEHFGHHILEVFDGQRVPRHDERVHALLAQVPIGFHVHLMERDRSGSASAPVERAEFEADLLAFELLAPSESIVPLVERLPAEQRREQARRVLAAHFGLPPALAARYAQILVPQGEDEHSFVRRLRLVR